MILTGECKEDFENWFRHFSEREHKYELIGNDIYFDEITLPTVFTTAIYIEFFDKVGYTIDRDTYNRKMIITDWRTGNENQHIIDCDYIELPFSNWYEEAIIKTNELYNNEADRTRRFYGDI